MKVGVIMGGISSEGEISLLSGEGMVKALKDSDKYEAIPVVIDSKEDVFSKTKDIDFALLALHGKFGEDGTIQAVLQTLGIPYSGCDTLSSALCMDKDLTKTILKAHGIRTAPWLMVTSLEEIDYKAIEEMGYPVVIKPNSGGSSVATFIVKEASEVYEAVSEGLKWDKEIMIEKYIKGDEITCPVMDGEIFPTLAIKPKSSFFDYTAKYTDGATDEFIVELEEELQKEVDFMTLECFKALKCSVYARVDFIISEGIPYLLEINTLPGMTKNSLFPKSAAGRGISFKELLELIIEKSLIVRG